MSLIGESVQVSVTLAPARDVKTVPVLHIARCECRNCGVHTMAKVGFKVAGSCPNCGSFDMVLVRS